MADEMSNAFPSETGTEADSSTFSRCMSCKHASEVDRSAGTMLCRRHNMYANAEADEIPDDCSEYEPGNLATQTDQGAS